MLNAHLRILFAGEPCKMSGEFRLTAASLRKMKRCCSMAGPKDVRNKWLAEFKETHCHSDFGKSLYKLLRYTSDSLDAKEDAEHMQIEVKRLETTYEDFFEGIEAEPIARFDDMLEQGSKNTTLLNMLAERLSGGALEKICKHMFETPDLNTIYVESFFCHFFPIYLKRPYTWFSLDILVKANKAHPAAFRKLLKMFLKDPDISTSMINDFVVSLDGAGKTEFLTLVMDSELNHKEFACSLVSIHSAFKTAEYSERVHNYIFDCLSRYATFCASDWNFGRLLFCFLQACTALNFVEAERIIEIHRSPFKRPCKTLLNELVERFNEAQLPADPSLYTELVWNSRFEKPSEEVEMTL